MPELAVPELAVPELALPDLASRISALLDHAPDAVTVLRARLAPVARLGLALEPSPALPAWIAREALDAVLLHRHWGLSLDPWPSDVGVLASHDAFDRRFGFGRSPELADALSLTLGGADDSLGDRDGHPLGSVGTARAACDVAAIRAALVRAFGGVEAELDTPDVAAPVTRVAMARAMTPALVERAAALGARVYVTGQLRVPGREPARRAGLHVFAVGHRRAERWGLARLGDALRMARPALDVRLAPADDDA
ncbi:MAG: Nif3-like dinuclear metal center hexameric protein [Gemmatirosa sp.]